MLAKDLIDRLERLGLLDQEIIEALRQQLDQAGARVTPEAVAKLLVDNGQLTSFQASKLIGELRSSQYDDQAVEVVEVVEDDSLTEGVVEGVEEVEVVAEAVEAEVMPVEVEVEAMPVEAVSADGTMEAVAMGTSAGGDRPRSRRPKPDPQKSVWDSFKIYGYLGILALLFIVGFGLYFILGRENADAVIQNANESYDQQAYEAAQSKYVSFLENFGEDHEYASIARTRVVMTQLYKAASFKQTPEAGVQKAMELLPQIKDEPGMNEERTNLAQLLVDIADNITKQAGRAPETQRKEELLGTLDAHQTLLDDPQYMSSTARVTLAGQIAAIQESRERVQRDINRNRRLDATETAMRDFLDEKKTKDAYDAHDALLRDFPELYANERLTTLIERASDIQQTLVSKSNESPEVTTAAQSQASTQSIVLTSLSGREAPDLRGETLYLRAGGSVLAFDGMTGKLKWRKFVGYAKDLPPVDVGDGMGVLLSDSSALEVVRCDADSGEKLWRSQIGETFHEPNAIKDNVFVTTDSGRLIALETDSGDSKWTTQIPQPLEVGPGVDEKRRLLYQPGNHSNLYLINGRDGSCVESFFTGHDEGTVSVSPQSLFGHLFVFENAGADYSIVHILKVDEDGKNIRVAQDQIRVIGNVHVQPIVQDRRLIVLTDLGEVKVFDVDPNAEGSQVSVVARLPPFNDRPTSTEMAVSGTNMWITGIRIGRYQLQINTQRVVRTWSKHELDQFIGRPFAGDDTLVHARILRDTSAIRVTAADQKTGAEIWSTDVGVPISMLKPAKGGVIHAVTTQAALFEIDRDAISTGSTKPPIEDISDRNVAIRFTDPVTMENNRSVFLDEAGGESFLVYDPNRPTEKLREISMHLPSGKPAGHLAFAGKGLFLPLDSGRAMLLNWQTGAVIASPFQPASDPATKVAWSDPANVADSADEVVIADNRKKLYRLRVSEQITEQASEELAEKFLGPAARIGATYFATTGGPAADNLVGHDMNSLDQKFSKPLPGRVVWGPAATESHCLVQTSDGQLRAFDESGDESFAMNLPPGKPVGKPVTVDGNLILVGQSGWYVAINESGGQLVGQDDLGQPISAAPLGIGKRLLIPGAEGVIYVASVPTEIAKVQTKPNAATGVALVEGAKN